MTAASSIDLRLQRVRTLMEGEGLSALVAFSPANCRYLTGFTGEATAVALTPGDLAIATDARFTEQAAKEVPRTRLLLPQADEDDDPTVQFLLEAAGADPTLPVGIETGHLTLKRWERLRPILEEHHLPWAAVDGLVERARQRKFPDELEALREAGALAAAAFAHLETLSVVGRSERDVALDLEWFLRRHGSEGVAFSFIVASGPRSAMPHGEASPLIIEPDRLVVFDLGAVVDGYASDISRTYATGPLDEDLYVAYELVRKAQAAALSAAKTGVTCRELDAIARKRIEDGGMGPLFTHSLGHGVGLEIHEAPMLNQRSQDTLHTHMVVTIEPGVYLSGRGGIRIEDTVVVTPTGAEILTECPRNLRVLH